MIQTPLHKLVEIIDQCVEKPFPRSTYVLVMVWAMALIGLGTTVVLIGVFDPRINHFFSGLMNLIGVIIALSGLRLMTGVKLKEGH